MIFTSDETICPECGIVFAVPTAWLEARRVSHETFYCPNGDWLSFPEATLADIRNNVAVFEKPRLVVDNKE